MTATDSAPVRLFLSLIADPLTVPILRAHREGWLRMVDLRECLDGVKQGKLRARVDRLRSVGALERHVRERMPYTVENELTEVGRQVLTLTDSVEAWLAGAPQGPIVLGSEEAQAAVKALVGGWDSTVLQALAKRPCSLVELDNLIAGLSYPSLERRLSAMRTTGLVEAESHVRDDATPYAITAWARQAVTSFRMPL